MARNAADALNMLPAGSIKSVKVFSSSSARYDAESAAGDVQADYSCPSRRRESMHWRAV